MRGERPLCSPPDWLRAWAGGRGDKMAAGSGAGTGPGTGGEKMAAGGGSGPGTGPGGACRHHEQLAACGSRAKYREGRRPRAVKVGPEAGRGGGGGG